MTYRIIEDRRSVLEWLLVVWVFCTGFLFAGFVHADVCYFTQSPDSGMGPGQTSFGDPATDAAAVKFTPVSDCDVTGVGAWLGRSSGIGQDVVVTLQTDVGDNPGVVIATGTQIAASVVDGNQATSTFSSVPLVGGTSYWAVFEGDDTGFFSDFYLKGETVQSPQNLSQRVSGSWSRNTSDTGWLEVDGTPPAPVVPVVAATSSVEQVQQNLSAAFFLFFVSFFGTVFIFRRR